MQNINLSEEETSAKIIDLNDSWKFKFQEETEWKTIDIPHDYSIIQKFDEKYQAASGFLPGGTAIYKKSFTIKSSNKKSIILYFYGVYKDAYIKINNKEIGENHYGYNSFFFDISDHIIFDGQTENVIEVKVEHELYSSRWYSGSGISRGVFLKISELLHLEIDNVKITTPDIENKKGTVNIEAIISNDSDDDYSFICDIKIKNKDNKIVNFLLTKEIQLEKKKSKNIKEQLFVENPSLWSDKDPYLYKIEIELLSENKQILDKYNSDFGFRYYSFDKNKGFIFNGIPTKLFGVSLHHDYGALGNIDNYDAAYKRLTQLKEMGINSIRTTHNIPYKTWINICDKIGLYVIEEFFDGWNYPKNNNTNDFSKYFNEKISKQNLIKGANENMTWAEFALQSAIKRDRNNPSIIMWSIGNEICCGSKIDQNSPNIAKKLIETGKKYDDTRPYTRADNEFRAKNEYHLKINDIIYKNGGIIGYNYARINELKEGAKMYDVIYLSESAASLNSRGVYSLISNGGLTKENDGFFHLTSYDTSCQDWGTYAKYSLYTTLCKDFVFGQFVWTGFDYLGETTPWNGEVPGSVTGKGAVPNTSYFGIIDTAGFPKDTYYLYRSQLVKNSVTLHIVNAWDKNNICFIKDKDGNLTNKTPVHIYSNAYKIELFRDDIENCLCVSTRIDHITEAGYSYFFYDSKSNNKEICEVVPNDENELGSELFIRYNIEFKEGTKLYTKAYDKNGNLIKNEEIIGNYYIKAPNLENLKLKVNVDKKTIEANGKSLAYVEVSIVDNEEILNSMGNNEITFNVDGVGKILGVDNGDQVTVDKFQQKSVLKNDNLACIKAFRGKALAIISSTKEKGKIKIKVSSGVLKEEIEIESI